MVRSKLIRAVLLITLAIGGTPIAAQDVAQVPKGWVGLRIQQALPRGAYVGGVDERGPAKIAGIMPGDVVIEFDGQKVGRSQDLPRILESTPVGKEVKVVVLRGGNELNLTVKVGQMDEARKPAVADGEVTCLTKEECHFLLGKMITALQAIAAAGPTPSADDIRAWHLVNRVYSDLMAKLPPELKSSVMADRQTIDAMLQNEGVFIARAEQQRDLAQKQLLAGQTAPVSPSPAQPASARDCEICERIDEFAKSAYSNGIGANGYYRGEPEGQLEKDSAIAGLLADYLVLQHCNLDNGSDLIVKLGEKIESLTADLPVIERQSISLLAKGRANQSIGSIDYQINVQGVKQASQCKAVFDADTVRFNPAKPPVFEPSQTAANVTPKQMSWIGVALSPAVPNAAYVSVVAEDSPAKAAGIMRGDAIVEFDNQQITEAGDLSRFVAGTPAGKQVEVIVRRGDEVLHLTLKIGQTLDVEAAMRSVIPADAVCQRTAIARMCEYSPQGFAGLTTKLDVYNQGEVQFGITFPDVHSGDRIPIPARAFDLNAYATDISQALGAMQPILEQGKYGFEKAQIDQCLQLPLPETDRPPNQVQFQNKDWTLSCWKGPENYNSFYHKGSGYIGMHADVKVTPPPPRNRF